MNLSNLEISKKDKRPFVISGPCSAESEAGLLETATLLKDVGIDLFRAGVWKPRTKPGGFEGLGEKALPWLARVKEEVGLPVATEIATPHHVENALKWDIDVFWIGARTATNPFAVQEIADALKGVDIPVLVKNPVNPDIELWIGALERLNNVGLKRIGAIHRGFSTYNNNIYRNAPVWSVPNELHRRFPALPVIPDPSHIGGKREFIKPLSQTAMDLGFDGLMIESHISPDEALSDARQQISPLELKNILDSLIVRKENISNEGLMKYRNEIDELDDQLMEILAKRMEISRNIGEYKKLHNLTVRQADRYREIIEKRALQGSLNGMSDNFVRKIFENIHDESVRNQLDLIN